MTAEGLFRRIGAALFDGGSLSDRDLQGFGQLDPDSSDVYEQARQTVARFRDGGFVPVNWELVELLEPIAVAQRPLDHPARQFTAHVACLAEVHRLARELDLYKLKADELARHSAALSGGIEGVEERIPASAVYETWRGKIDSLVDRDSAARRFRDAYRESPDFVDVMMAEPGSRVYFSESELADPPTARISSEAVQRALHEQVERRSDHFPPATLYLQLSMDTAFLRAFGPYWFGLAPTLLRQGLGVSFLVVGDEEETAPLIEEAREMIRAAAAFRGLSRPSAAAESVIFVPTGVPEGTGKPKTYAACARLAHAEAALVETESPLLVLDADIVLWDDLRPLLKSIGGADLGCSYAPGLRSLRPWSRHLAGLVYLAPTDAGRAAAARVRAYMERGLGCESSWTLDQNALCYVLENPGECRVSRMKLNAMMAFALQPDKRVIHAMQEVY